MLVGICNGRTHLASQGNKSQEVMVSSRELITASAGKWKKNIITGTYIAVKAARTEEHTISSHYAYFSASSK